MLYQKNKGVEVFSMGKRKGLFITLLLLAAIIAGCGGTTVENKGSNAEDSIKATDLGAATDKLRTFTDALGKEIVLDKQPGKIAALWYFYPEILTALGEAPAGSTEKEYLSSLSYLAGKLDSTEELGDKVSPSIEKILSLAPDYILATEHHEKIYESLEKVAPVITLNSKSVYDDWKYGIRTVGEIIGKEAEAEQVISEMMKEIENGRDTLKSTQGQSIALILSWDGKTFNVLGEGNPVYKLAFDGENGLGLTPANFKGVENQFTTFEGMATVEAEHIFLIGEMTKQEVLMDELKQNKVWNHLKAVANENVYLMDTSAITGGPLAIQYALEHIVDALR